MFLYHSHQQIARLNGRWKDIPEYDAYNADLMRESSRLVSTEDLL